MIHTPVHASWLNQLEIFFSVIQKKVISPNDFASLEALSATLLAFVDRYNATARPFNWKFTAADLTALLRRISESERPAREPAGLHGQHDDPGELASLARRLPLRSLRDQRSLPELAPDDHGEGVRGPGGSASLTAAGATTRQSAISERSA
jgi:hypothetical protein